MDQLKQRWPIQSCPSCTEDIITVCRAKLRREAVLRLLSPVPTRNRTGSYAEVKGMYFLTLWMNKAQCRVKWKHAKYQQVRYRPEVHITSLNGRVLAGKRRCKTFYQQVFQAIKILRKIFCLSDTVLSTHFCPRDHVIGCFNARNTNKSW